MLLLRFSNDPRAWMSLVIIFDLLSSSSAFNFFKSRNPVQPRQDYDPDIEPYDEYKKHERKIFDYEKNGVKVDLRVIPAVDNSSRDEEDHFPAFPISDIGRCILDFSMACIRERMARYIATMTNLERINLYGKSVKLVKIRSLPARVEERALDPVKRIDQNIDDFFDTFALRISLPKDNRRKEINQIEVKYDDKVIGEARGGKGGGGGKGGKGGGCKKMMMCMVMAAKMKMMGMIGLMSMKGLMLAGISMMMTKAMLIMQLLSKKGGGGYSGGGGGQLKEIVLLTKASGGGGGGCGQGGGCGGGSSPSSSYGAPLSSSFGAPPPTGGGGGGGGGGYDFNAQGGGGGWGRSFNNGLPVLQPDQLSTNRPSQIVDASIVFTQPQQKLNNQDWILLDNYKPEQQRIGEVLETAEPSNYLINKRTDRKLNDDKFTKKHNKMNKINEPEIVYANNWHNYEVADRIWNNMAPIVATRIIPAPQSTN